MTNSTRLQPFEVAQQFIKINFPTCQAAILAGSVVRGEATETSDLDIVIFDKDLKSSYRESLIQFEWKIELFAHNLTSYKYYFKKDVEEARPCMPRMVNEGIIIKNSGVLKVIKAEAKNLLDAGPKEWSIDTINIKRYFISDVLDDLIGSKIGRNQFLLPIN